jgi:exonuclease III
MLIKLRFASWNVRGLGRRGKRDDVRAAIDSFLPSILCLQESKLSSLSPFFASSFLPPSLRSFVFKPSVGASGGIITAWDSSVLDLVHHSVDEFSLTTTFSFWSDNLHFMVVNVYGPCTHGLKPAFLDSLRSSVSRLTGSLAILGDFNLIRSPRERSNDNFNLAEASIFIDFVNQLGLLEIPLLDWQFTWSNQQTPPIMARLDRVFVNPEWSLALPDTTLTSSARPTSDHVPLHLEASSKAPRSTIFRLENVWLSHSGFRDIVYANWGSVGTSH